MTLQVGGQISMSDINAEFGRGTSLSNYLGVTWYTDAGGSGTFPSGPISMSDFYGKRSSSPGTTISYTAEFSSQGGYYDEDFGYIPEYSISNTYIPPSYLNGARIYAIVQDIQWEFNYYDFIVVFYPGRVPQNYFTTVTGNGITLNTSSMYAYSDYPANNETDFIWRVYGNNTNNILNIPRYTNGQETRTLTFT